MTREARVVFQPFNIVAQVPEGTNLLDAIRDAGIWCESICGGKGECGKCRVVITRGRYESSDCSGKHIGPADREQGAALACEITVTGDLEVTIPVESRIRRPQILAGNLFPEPGSYPAVRRYAVDRRDPGSYPFPGGSVVLSGYAGPRPRIPDERYQEIISRKSAVFLVVTTSPGHPEVIRVDPEGDPGPLFGLALDLGTTTLAGVLVDLANGRILHQAYGMNRQITYGEELVTRIACTRDPGGLGRLKEAAVDSINAIIEKLVAAAGVRASDIVEVCIGSNTVMNYLLLGEDPRELEMAGTRVNRKAVAIRAAAIGVDILPGGYIWCIPAVSRFLGGDVIGDLIAAGIADQPELSLLVDLGTNGEVVFGNRDWLTSASCAAGPAFEGAGVRSGMRAMEGAIDHVVFDAEEGSMRWTVIGNSRPRGICGSGIIDAVLALYRSRVMDFAGKLVSGSPGVRPGPDGQEYLLAGSGSTAHGRDIVITQRDLDYFMDSKAALCGAIAVLMKKHHIGVGDVRHVYLAGAFGAFTDIGNAVELGILPRFPRAIVHQLGNGSLAGAYATLTSESARNEAERLAAMMDYIDLLVDTDFIEEYSSALYIPGRKDLFPGA